MPITEEQRIERKKFIGASDVPAIMGIDKFRNHMDIYVSKTMDIPHVPNAAMDAGTILEQSVVAWAEKQLEMPLERDVRFVNGIFAANCDAVNTEHGVLVEAKTCSITGYSSEHSEWGEPMSDQVPGRIILQVQAQFYCAGEHYQTAYVPVLIGQRGFCMYQIERSQEIINHIVERCTAFWNNVLNGTPPEELPAYALLHIDRVPGKEVPIEESLVERYLMAQETKRFADDGFEVAKNALLSAMGDAEKGLSNYGTFSFLETKRKAYAVPESKYRVLRFKKGVSNDQKEVGNGYRNNE